MIITIERTKPGRKISVHDMPFGGWAELKQEDDYTEVVHRLSDAWFHLYNDVIPVSPMEVKEEFFGAGLDKVLTIEGKIIFEIDA